jgi:hypothetical protein
VSTPAPKRATKARRPNAIEPSSLRPDSKEKVASDTIVIDPVQIAALAYSHWEARGGREGSPEVDWLRAERQLQTGG